MKKTKQKEIDSQFTIQVALVAFLFGILIASLIGISGNGGASTVRTVSASDIIPAGVPSIYGDELKISFDDVSPNNPQKADSTIRLLGNIDRSEILDGPDLERYINILYKLENGISCEYCCGARAVIFENGQPACGCAHSYAIRGLTKFLIKYHGSEYTDEQILEEVGKWKVLFFPGIHEAKAKVLSEKGIDLNYINIASNKYRGIEKGQQSSGGMVGGC